MTTVNPLGVYSVFDTQGKPVMWSDQPTRIEVTMQNRVLIYAGTWEKPVAECNLPLFPFTTREIFEGYCRMLVERAKTTHVNQLCDRIGMAIVAMQQAMAEKEDLNRQYMAKQINADKWRESLLKIQEEMTLTRDLILAMRDEINRNGHTLAFVLDQV